ncbi:hypothetical protein TrVE_jg1704 [Triparma verrucosa]|uniref:Ribosome biogenesis protein NOP53 n=1 Tax=Triparma verrucosa TaxID=1606542 RepID=A0A9W7EPZ7_9STRA|nr:hypothetical protein TrVE_jg1704 [Triparma verrucosa]
MGKTKKRAASRMKEQRDSEIAAVAADVESQLPAGGSEEALFVLDTEGQGKKRRRRMAATEKKLVSGGIVLSNNVKKQLKAHSKEELQKIAEKGRKSLERKGRQGHAMKKEKPHDLWGENPSDAKKQKPKLVNRGGIVPGTHISEVLRPELTTRTEVEKFRREPKKKKNIVTVAPAHAGQSYNPDFSAHQDMLGMAVAVENRRKEMKEEEKAPVMELSEKTRSILVGPDSESSDSDSDDDLDSAPANKVVRRDGKKTKAQRNREKRHKQLLLEHQKKKESKQLLNQLTELKKNKREVLASVKESESKKKEINTLKAETDAKPIGVNVDYEDFVKNPKRSKTIPVALSNEVGSMRKTRSPAGAGALHDSVLRLESRSMLERRKVGMGKKKMQGKLKGRNRFQAIL